MSRSLAEAVASLALDAFSALPKKCKPRTLEDGSKEWTPLSAIVLHLRDTNPIKLHIVSLATGTKSLPLSAIPKCEGLILHDSHAEILVLRAFNYWLLCEAERVLEGETSSCWLRFQPGSSTPFALHENVEISMFSTEAPCGDASMELLIATNEAQGQDVEPWRMKELSPTDSSLPPSGRGYFSNLGALRRKPARADAEISMSKSCSDKLMLKQITGLLSFPIDHLIEQSDTSFLTRLIVYHDQYNETSYRRAFAKGGRIRQLECASCPHVKEFQHVVLPQDFRRFEFERPREVDNRRRNKVSNVSCIWVAGIDDSNPAVTEVIVNGVRQGFKQFDSRAGKGSSTCRKRLVSRAIRISNSLHNRDITSNLHNLLNSQSYSVMKGSAQRLPKSKDKQFVLDSLGGWPTGKVQDDFEIDVPVPEQLETRCK